MIKGVIQAETGAIEHYSKLIDVASEVDPVTEPGEYDQEQHDAVRDVFRRLIEGGLSLALTGDLKRAAGQRARAALESLGPR